MSPSPRPPASRGLEELDGLSPDAAESALLEACGSRAWARRMVASRPFRSTEALLERADSIWRSLSEAEWREALAAHPRIGDRSASGRAAREQAGALDAGASVLGELAAANAEYETRFGHIFVVCAAGKTATEMLALCQARLHNDASTEIRVAAEEQRKITRLRLEALTRAE